MTTEPPTDAIETCPEVLSEVYERTASHPQALFLVKQGVKNANIQLQALLDDRDKWKTIATRLYERIFHVSSLEKGAWVEKVCVEAVDAFEKARREA